MTTKHPAITPLEMLPKRRLFAYESLPLEVFQQFVEKSALKLSKDECYSMKTCQQFVDYKLDFDTACEIFDLFKELIYNFKGNAEKFYPQFYKINYESKIVPNLTRRSEVAKLVLAHIGLRQWGS